MAQAKQKSDITPEMILRAYSIGLFPMADDEKDEALFWVDPEERGVFPLDGLIVSRSLAKVVHSDRFEVVVDQDFDAVIDHCAHAAARDRTWINAQIRKLYRTLFDYGFVHTVECRRNGALAGGLYGVSLGAGFFGESMFHIERDASKVALVHLVARLRAGDYRLLDTQFVTPHLATLGAIGVPRADYQAQLALAMEREGDFHHAGKISGAQALRLLESSDDSVLD